VKAALDGFLAELARNGRHSPHTVAAYRRDLTALCAWCALQGIRAWPKLTTAQLQLWLAEGHDGGLNPRTLARST
jgi:integrase/recombinase XerC